jgi:pyruvate dehydrogenase E1 component alpha subunit
VLFVCENNFYAMGTSMRKVSALAEIYKRAEAYGIRSEQVDGMDILAMRDRTDQALKLVRRGEGPYFLEAITYRYRGHSMADPEFYRNKQEVEHWRSLDPIRKFEELLTTGGHMTEDEVTALRKQVEQEVNEATQFAINSPDPPVESLMDYVYAPDDHPEAPDA